MHWALANWCASLSSTGLASSNWTSSAPTATIVIIETQLEKTDHTHLGQIIAYAAGVGARKVIWIAEKFRPEHAAALQFLNDNTTDDLDFFAVEVELWRIGDSPLAPKFRVVVKPDNWTKASREQMRAASATTPIKQLQQKFWIALKEYLAQHAPNIRPQQARPQHWLNNSIGRSGFGLNVTANAREERFGIELYIHSAQAKQHFDNLYAQKVDIEAKLGFALDWQRLEDAQATRIAAWLPNASIENEARWPEYQAWISQQLCIDPAEPAQVMQLKRMPVLGSSCRAPGAGAGRCKSVSSRRSRGWHVGWSRSDAGARTVP